MTRTEGDEMSKADCPGIVLNADGAVVKSDFFVNRNFPGAPLIPVNGIRHEFAGFAAGGRYDGFAVYVPTPRFTFGDWLSGTFAVTGGK